MNYYPCFVGWLMLVSYLLVTGRAQAQVWPKTDVLLLGTYGLVGSHDALTGAADDLLGPQRQKEINEILACLQAYKPTKIFIDSYPRQQLYWDSLYALLDQGIIPSDPLVKSESYQFGTRLAQRLHLPQAVISVDWDPTDTTSQSVTDRFYRVYRRFINQEYERINAPISTYFSPMSRPMLDEIRQLYASIGKRPIKEALLRLNDPLLQRKLYYVNNMIGIDKDAFQMGVAGSLLSVVRHLYIYRNIIHHIAGVDEKVLIIYSAGHTEALRQLFTGNSRFNVVLLEEILKK